MSDSPYVQSQARSNAAAYARYLAGMDASMRQKVALTAAHLLCEGRIADMGMGSGQGSHALACLYPLLAVTGVDIDATIVSLAQSTYNRPNLAFVTGDIAQRVFLEASLDGIFDSSVLHHVTSYGGYRHDNAKDALAAQVAQLREGGVVVVRDFVAPASGTVFLDVPANDGADCDDPRTACTAALLERFSREFRSLSPEPGFALKKATGSTNLPDPAPGRRRYQLDHRHAVEFVLRKDYRADWESEVKEEYTYFTQRQFEDVFAGLGLRVLASLPLYNPWIVRNRFRDRFALWSQEGTPIAFPATNYLIVGEKVPATHGVAFAVQRKSRPLGFLNIAHHCHQRSGRVFDLAARPHPTLDIVPFFSCEGSLYVLARTSYPRPILSAGADVPLDGRGEVAFVAEPLCVLQNEQPLGATVEHALLRNAGLDADHIKTMEPGSTYYPSPGGILEEVRSVFVQIKPSFVNEPSQANVSGFSTSGRVRAIECQQLLRAAQVGGMPDARLELNTFDLLLRLEQPLGPWIGEEIRVQQPQVVKRTELAQLFKVPRRRMFRQSKESAGFLRVQTCLFQELDREGQVVAEQLRELVEPGPLSGNTVVAAVFARDAVGDILMAVDDDDLPAAQQFNGNSNLIVAPAWRIPHAFTQMESACEFVQQRLRAEYGLQTGGAIELGGAYRPSAGLTPELVFPFAFELRETLVPADRHADESRALAWISLRDLVTERHRLADGHLRIVVGRLAHALGLVPVL